MAAVINEIGTIMQLSEQEFTTLKTTGTLTKDGVTYTYSPNNTIYVTPYNESGGHNYSTNEQVIGTWINGKPLYETTLVVNLTSAYEEILLTNKGISNIEFATITEVTLIDDEGIVFPLNMVIQSGNTINDVQFTTAYLVIDGSNSVFCIDIAQVVSITLPATVYATLHYTKTTD